MTPLTPADQMRARRDESAAWIALAVRAKCSPLPVDLRAFNRRDLAYRRLLSAAIEEAAA